jgi:2-oxoglutarate dehydrogenase E1 component
MMLIRTYRVRGHLAADLDPLGPRQARASGRSHARISRLLGRRARSPVYLGGTLASRPRRARTRRVPPRQLLRRVGLEYMHINDLEERRFLQDRMEGRDAEISFTELASSRSSPR